MGRCGLLGRFRLAAVRDGCGLELAAPRFAAFLLAAGRCGVSGARLHRGRHRRAPPHGPPCQGVVREHGGGEDPRAARPRVTHVRPRLRIVGFGVRAWACRHALGLSLPRSACHLCGPVGAANLGPDDGSMAAQGQAIASWGRAAAECVLRVRRAGRRPVGPQQHCNLHPCMQRSQSRGTPTLCSCRCGLRRDALLHSGAAVCERGNEHCTLARRC
mmetsp:Transcript_65271/g.181476  ORF Transcript_65271/g.181476 Transcript_65271/m.181476 type:complete len:216 (+) Transcript_65271:515-1162(+)